MKLTIIFALAAAAVVAANLDAETKILNGHPAGEGEAPFIVSLKRKFHFCAGSIIDEHWVLTAAHCLAYNTFEIVAGLHDRKNESNAQIRTVPSKDYQIVHKKYGGKVGPYDIGLIYVAEPFNFTTMSCNGSALVTKIKLPTSKYNDYGKGKLYGWGRNNYGFFPNTLQTLDANIISYRSCKEVLPSSAPLDPLNLCSYNAGTTDGACDGDSGGPLVRDTPSGTEIVGIASWGSQPCNLKTPSVYTRVSDFIGWIKKAIDNFNPPKLNKLIVDEKTY